MKPRKNFDGVKFNSLTVIRDFECENRQRVVWCRCDCGKEKSIVLAKLKNGSTKSCGRGCKFSPLFRHGLSNTKFYHVWENMISRTTSQNNMHYGGRGIGVCIEWRDFKNFHEDMFESYEETLSIERVDVDSDYSKDNCIWTNQSVQTHNRRKYRGNCESYGVHWCERDKSFICSIVKNKKCYQYYSKDENICKIAYDNASSLLYGDRPNKTEETQDELFLRVKKDLSKKGMI